MPRFKLSDLPEHYQKQIAAQGHGAAAVPAIKRRPGDEPAVPDAPEAGDQGDVRPGRITIWIISYRCHLADPDACYGKHLVDQLAAGLGLPDDSLEHVKEVRYRQVQVRKKEEERTDVEAWLGE